MWRWAHVSFIFLIHLKGDLYERSKWRQTHIDWTDAPADLNGLIYFAKRRNLVSACVPSHFMCCLLRFTADKHIAELCSWNLCTDIWHSLQEKTDSVGMAGYTGWHSNYYYIADIHSSVCVPLHILYLPKYMTFFVFEFMRKIRRCFLIVH
jgi:hypothetical protein